MKYKIIYADPPWTYKTYSDKGKGKSAEKHYKTMTKEELQNLDIESIAEKDCVLFLWVTFPTLLEGISLITKWGFVYKTCAFNWVKTNKNSQSNWRKAILKVMKSDGYNKAPLLTKVVMIITAITKQWFWGLGHWTRSNSELCLLATKGHPKRVSKSVHQVIDEPVGKHSAKPDIVRERIIQLVGDLPRVELFARERVDGWEAFGNEIEGSIIINKK